MLCRKNTRSTAPQSSSTFHKVSISSASIVSTHQPNTLNLLPINQTQPDSNKPKFEAGETPSRRNHLNSSCKSVEH
ncbi:hypothetical protein ASPTUDRAFT_42102 [Aspergillus tubingensis CBS 134.48]|uniref:Uncharacterized protein n=1 Tax=Aspergillus tubingensis (strain CBS 134.48) TaxID=767770 RepID=A0A1L9N987_ASPTC|nr:hypothetical protein ASPTUDRAFT_42102 [Aspergillus tubingensis CBS 134.48]